MPTNTANTPTARRPASCQPRQPPTNAANIADRITDRAQLLRLRDLVRELNEKHDKPFRWIAKVTWRGESKFSYWQQVARGAHLKTQNAIRPRRIDLLNLESVLAIVRETARAQTELAILLDEFLEARAVSDQKLVALVLKSARRARK